jgi:hypothetical protein
MLLELQERFPLKQCAKFSLRAGLGKCKSTGERRGCSLIVHRAVGIMMLVFSIGRQGVEEAALGVAIRADQ